MPGYKREQIVKLERILVEQTAIKAEVRKRKAHLPKGFKSLSDIARELKLTPMYVRRFAFERNLDPFPGRYGAETGALVEFLVTRLGYSVKQAALKLGIKVPTAQAYMNKRGWNKFVMWARKTNYGSGHVYMHPLFKDYKIHRYTADQSDVTEGHHGQASSPAHL